MAQFCATWDAPSENVRNIGASRLGRGQYETPAAALAGASQQPFEPLAHGVNGLGRAFWLALCVVLGIWFHATGYMIADPWMLGGVSPVMALTVFMFDRALYRSD